MSRELLLVVCIANICRSPLGEILLQEGLDPAIGIQVGSAGTRARPDASICPRVATHRTGERWAARTERHRSRQLTPEMLDEATLILAMSTDVRSEVIGIAPSVRSRTVTVQEAVHLGSGFVARSPDRGRSLLAQYAEHLDGARALRGAVPEKGRGWGGHRRGGPDIADGHNRGPREHRRTIHQVESAVALLCDQLRAHSDA